MNIAQLMEICFNLLYLIGIALIIIAMAVKSRRGLSHNPRISSPFLAAFLLLALGDTGHVGLRVWAYLAGGLERNAFLLGTGKLATAFTVTLFYMLMMVILYRYSSRRADFFYIGVMVLGLERLIFIFLPGNAWENISAPLNYSYIRNAMLTLMGLTTALLFLREGVRKGDSFLKAAAGCILISFAFYLPVILFVHINPGLGMLMIPKTLAYVALAVIGNRALFRRTAS